MGVQEDIKALGGKLTKMQEDPEKFRFSLAIALLVFGMLAVKMPLAARIQGKRLDLAQAEQLAERAERVMQLRSGAALFEPRLHHSSEPSDWQEYLYGVVAETGVTLGKQEKSDLKGLFDFKQIVIPVEVTGTYAQIWAFVETIERGERLMRFESMSLTVTDGILSLRSNLIGIARPDTGGEYGGGMMMDGEGEAPPPTPEHRSEEEDIA